MPLPPSLEPILLSLPRRLADLQTFQLPRLQSCTGPADLHAELVDEMRGDMEGVRYNLEVLRETTESLSEREKASVTPQVDQLEQEYLDLKRAYRQAMLTSQRNIASRRSRIHDLARKDKPDEIVADAGAGSTSTSAPGGEKGKTTAQARSAADFGMGGDDELQTKTNEVTTALRRTTALMQTELERSVLSVQMLETSTQTLTLTNALHTRYTALLQTGTQLVRALEKADTLDRILILSALLFFLLVVGFILKRRVLDRTVGVVIGGVGRGVGWYLFGTGRLVKMAVMGRGREEVPAVVGDTGVASEGNGQGVGAGADVDGAGEPLAQVGSDSAVNGGGKILYEDVPEPAPGSVPYVDQGIDRIRAGKGGKVEIIAHDQGERITPSWERDEL
ncbi:hypothetical protein IAT38_004030 [Cryptococcus sp. DSM 104549]